MHCMTTLSGLSLQISLIGRVNTANGQSSVPLLAMVVS